MKVRNINFKYCVGVRGIVNCIFVNKPLTIFIHRKTETATHHQKLVLLLVYFLMEVKYRGERPVFLFLFMLDFYF